MKRAQLVNWVLLVLWMFVIFLFSSEAADSSSARSGVVVDYISQSFHWPQDILTFLTRKAAHMFLYFVLGLLIFNAVRGYRLSSRTAALLSVAFVILYAVTDEFHQSFVPGRSAELRDVVIDTVSGAVGAGMLFLITKTSKKIKNDV